MKAVCTVCGHVWKTKTRLKGSMLMELWLLLLLIIPWLIYSIWRMTNKQKVCRMCWCDKTIPVNTPLWKKLLKEQEND